MRSYRASVLMVLVTVTGVLGLAAAAYSESGPSANGGGGLIHPLLGEMTANTVAVTLPDGSVTGHWNWKLHELEGFAKSSVECLRVEEELEGNVAVFSGTIHKGTLPFPPFELTGFCFVVAAMDRGEGDGSPLDLTSDALLFPCGAVPAEIACNVLIPLPPSIELTIGNFEVRP